jgi:peptidoglycan/LPS O-acetylase OafA/YrhL
MDHLKAHTGLRGVAAMTVAPIHMYCEVFVPGFDTHVMPWLNGFLAVDIFFMLSGFILPYVYFTGVGCHMKSSWKSFFIARLARIYPLHLATIIAAGAMVLAGKVMHIPMGRPYEISDLLPQLLLIHAFPGVEVWGWIHPSWSICMEALAYVAFFPVIGIWIRRKSGLFAKVSLIGALAILYLTTYAQCDEPEENAAMGWFAIGRVFTCFTMGMVLWSFLRDHDRLTEKLQSCSGISLAVFILGYIGSSLGAYPFPWLILVVPFMILGLTSNAPSFPNRILGNRVVVWLGTISYSIYLIHTLFGKIVAGLASKIDPGPMTGVLMLILVFALLLGISSLSYHWFENPARRWIQNKLNTGRQP